MNDSLTRYGNLSRLSRVAVSFAVLGAGLCGLVLSVGCSPEPIAESSLEDSQRAFDEALSAMESKDHARALESFTVAIDAGGLSPDQAAEAYFRRGACNAELGDFDAALADLESASEGYGNLEEVHELRASIFDAQGKSAEAEAERQQAAQFRS
jgi:tetratricopeptide (TPR) repeat protein